MSETSGFFEAQWDESLTNPITEEQTGWWDRDYLASQWMEFMQMFLGNGVFVSPVNQCKVIPGTGMTVMVTPGWAFINGAWYHNDANLTITIPSNTTSSSRIDSIKLRYSEATRAINAVSANGSTSVTRGDSVYELKLAEVTVDVGAVTISASKITDTRSNENVCGFVKGLVEVVDTNDLFTQFTDIFNNWFDDVKGQITGDLGAKLQLEFTQLNNAVEQYQANVTEQVEVANDLVEGYVYNDYVTDELTFTFVNKSCEVSDSRVTLNTLLDLYFTDDTIQEAEDCQITIDSGVGKYILKAVKQPSKSLKGRIRVRINSTIPQLPEEFDDYATKSYVASNYYNKTEIEPIVKLFNLISSSTDVAATHNSIVIHKDITEYYTDGTLWDRIAGTNGFKPFEGIYPGMYFDTGVTVKAPGQTGGSSKIMICGLNMHWNNYQQVRFNHLTCCPLTHFGDAKMNDTNTTVGGYVGSKMYTDILGSVATTGNTSGTINEQLFAIFGSHLKTIKEILSTSLNASGYNRFGSSSGCSDNWDWRDVQSVLFSEVEAYGSIVWSSSGYDTGCAKKQMPAFRDGVNLLVPNEVYWWLKDVTSESRFCSVDFSGLASYAVASIPHYVRPRFILA